MNISDRDILLALTSGVPGPERVDRVSVEVDRWLAEHGVSLESHMTARARQAGFKQKEEIEDLQLATLEVVSRRLRNQALGVPSSFVFDGRIKFEGYVMCLFGDPRRPRGGRGGVIMAALRAKRQAARLFSEEDVMAIPAHVPDEDERRWRAVDLEGLLVTLSPHEHAIVGLSSGMHGTQPSAPVLAEYLRSVGMSPADVQRIESSARSMTFKPRKHNALKNAEIAALFGMSADKMKKIKSSVISRLRLAADAPPHRWRRKKVAVGGTPRNGTRRKRYARGFRKSSTG